MFKAPRHRAVFAIDGIRGHGTSHTSISRVAHHVARAERGRVRGSDSERTHGGQRRNRQGCAH
eukprot:scaffold80309_cov72-Phaeocystis_antarctica.AAC.6